MSTWSPTPAACRALAGELGLRLRQRDPRDVDAVLLGRVDGEGAPAAADVQDALARLQGELGADELALGELGLFQGLSAARPDRARVRHRLVQEQREELVGEVVVVRDRALVAQDRVARALGAQLHRRHARDGPQGAGLHRAGGDPRLELVVDRRRRPVRQQRERGVHVVDFDPAADVGAAHAELRGRAQHVAERGRRGQRERRPGGAVGRWQHRSVPQRERRTVDQAAPRRARCEGPACCSRGELRRLALRRDTHDVPC